MAGLQGRVFGGFQLTEPLPGGGIAEAYRAQPVKPGGREVVVKVIHPEFAALPGFLPHFRRIVGMSSRLTSHPHILPLMHSGEENGYLYLVSPFVAAGTMRDWLQKDGRLGAADVAPFFRQLCDALTYAHSLGVMHGNIKPSNVFLFEGRHVLLGDFGLLWDVTLMDMQHAGSGTEAVEYLAPEVTGGQSSQQSDIYSLGALLFAAIAGHAPFRGVTPADIFAAHAHQAVPSLAQSAAGQAPSVYALDNVIQRAMAKQPEARFPSAAAVAQAIEITVQNGAVPPTPAVAHVQAPIVSAPMPPTAFGAVAAGPMAMGPVGTAGFAAAPAGNLGVAAALAGTPDVIMSASLAQLSPPFPPLPPSATPEPPTDRSEPLPARSETGTQQTMRVPAPGNEVSFQPTSHMAAPPHNAVSIQPTMKVPSPQLPGGNGDLGAWGSSGNLARDAALAPGMPASPYESGALGGGNAASGGLHSPPGGPEPGMLTEDNEDDPPPPMLKAVRGFGAAPRASLRSRGAPGAVPPDFPIAGGVRGAHEPGGTNNLSEASAWGTSSGTLSGPPADAPSRYDLFGEPASDPAGGAANAQRYGGEYSMADANRDAAAGGGYNPEPGGGHEWGTSSDERAWGTSSDERAWGTSSDERPWGTSSDERPWGASSDEHAWGASSDERARGTNTDERPWGPSPDERAWGGSSGEHDWRELSGFNESEQNRDLSGQFGGVGEYEDQYTGTQDARGSLRGDQPAWGQKADDGREFSATQLGLPRLTDPEHGGAIPSWQEVVSDERNQYGGRANSPARHDDSLDYSSQERPGDRAWEQPDPRASWRSESHDQGDRWSRDESASWPANNAAVGGWDESMPMSAALPTSGARGAVADRDDPWLAAERASTEVPSFVRGTQSRHGESGEWAPAKRAVRREDTASYAAFDDDKVWTTGSTAVRPRRRISGRLSVLLVLLLLFDGFALVVARPDLCPVQGCNALSATIHQRLPFLAGSGISGTSVLTTTPSALHTTATPGKTANTSVSIKNTSTAKVTWQASASLPWVSITPATGTLEAGGTTAITVAVQPAGIAPGSYSAAIMLKTGQTTVAIPVAISVNSGAQLSVSPTSLSFSSCGTTKSFLVKDTGTADLTFAAVASSSSALALSVSSGKLAAGASKTVGVTLLCAAAAGSRYTVNVTSNSGSAVVAVQYGQ